MLVNAQASFLCPDPLGREELCPAERFQRPIDSNNPLAVELEKENDHRCEDFYQTSLCQPCQ
jgi:hypothetical protein